MRSRTIRACIAGLALLLLGAAGARAADRVVTLEAADGQVALGGAGEFWIDRTGATLAQVAGDASLRWAPTVPGAVYALDPDHVLWMRFVVDVHDQSQRWYLEVPYSAVDELVLATIDAQGRWTERRAGDTLPVSSWPVPHRHPLLPLATTPGKPQQFWLRVENSHSFGAPVVFASERELLRQEQRTSLFLGLYFGLTGLSVVLALLAGISVRDTAFAWYALTVTLMGLSQAALTGIAGLHLWPQWAWWNNVSVFVLPMAAVAALLCFVCVMVSLPQRSASAARLQRMQSVALLAVAVATMLVDPSWRVWLMVTAISLGLTTGIAIVVWAATRGDRHAMLLLVGMSPVAIGSAFPLARAAGLIAVSFWTTNGTLIGIAMELPVLMVVLARRMQERRENTRRISRLERIDPATGLVNAHVFHERLVALIARSERLRHSSVVMLVDLANVEQVRREWDRRSAEEMPIRLASRLLSCARDIDTAARLSDHRFGLLIEGPLTPAEAAASGARIVAACLRPFDDKPVQWVPQVRVAQTVVPGFGDAQHVQDKLESLLASVPVDSKRAVFSVGMDGARAPQPA